MTNWTRTPCRSCGAPVIWARHQLTGREMPIDAEPVTGGTITIEPDMFGAPSYWIAAGTPPPGAERHTSHFATCPNAGSWRKARTGHD